MQAPPSSFGSSPAPLSLPLSVCVSLGNRLRLSACFLQACRTRSELLQASHSTVGEAQSALNLSYLVPKNIASLSSSPPHEEARSCTLERSASEDRRAQTTLAGLQPSWTIQ